MVNFKSRMELSSPGSQVLAVACGLAIVLALVWLA